MGWVRIAGTIVSAVIIVYGVLGTTVTFLSTKPETIAENSTVWALWAGRFLPQLNASWTDLTISILWVILGVGIATALNVSIPRVFRKVASAQDWAGPVHGPHLHVGKGDPFRGEGVMPEDADLIYRIAIEAPTGLSYEGLKVEVRECDPPGAFAIGTPFRLMHEGYSTLRGFDLDGGQTKYLELLDARVKRRRVARVQPSHAVAVKPRVVSPGTYSVTMKITGTGIDPLLQRFQITVSSDLLDPVAIVPSQVA